MNKRLWDLYAPVYTQAMKADRKIYDFMYARISRQIRNKEVLELAAGPGVLAKQVAPYAKAMLATDYSERLACCIQQEDHSPDCTDVYRVCQGEPVNE